MEKTVLIVDDQKEQAEGLKKILSKEMPGYNFESYTAQDEILEAIEHKFYSLAIVDIRMDDYDFDGIELVKKIFEVNPFAKVIIVSAFRDEYFAKLKDLLLTGKVIEVLEKELVATWAPKLKKIIEEYYDSMKRNPSELNQALLQFYAEAKNEDDTYKKGERFEHFISLLFGSFGYKQILKRVKDMSSNEVDLIVRNETADSFLNKFGKYILIECKNKPKEGVGKNDFIVFMKKLQNTNGLAQLGILATTGYIARTTYLEALRDSSGVEKVIFISNPEIERLIKSSDKFEELKRIIDDQVKDN